MPKQPNAEGAKDSQRTQKIPFKKFKNDSNLRARTKDFERFTQIFEFFCALCESFASSAFGC